MMKRGSLTHRQHSHRDRGAQPLSGLPTEDETLAFPLRKTIAYIATWAWD